jgi:adenylate cyclase
MARGALPEADVRLDAAAAGFAKAGYRLDESRVRRALATVKAMAGDRAGAEMELRRVLGYAAEFGAVREGEHARKQLTDLGIETSPESLPPQPDATSVGERFVTVMFIDVRGYTGMASKQAPEELADRVASFHRWSRQEIERRHGLVDKFAGDAVMATFNVSGARVDHCVQALQAAFAIRDKAAATGLPVGTGIAVGAAMVGALTQGANLSVVGEVTNLASRLQAQAAAGEILLSGEAHRRVEDWLASHELVPQKESLELKGFENPVTVYRLRAGARTSAAQSP